MADPALLERLKQHRTLGAAPVEELAWLAEHGALRAFAIGDVVVRKGERIRVMYVMFAGHVVIRADRGVGAQKLTEARGGDVTGHLPYSRGAVPRNDGIAEQHTEVLEIPEACFPELTLHCPQITAMLVHAMLDRARMITSGDLHNEKLLSLGRLAAGLAHELNNPASATVRNAKTLAESQEAAEAAARRVGAARLSDAQLAAVDRVREQCLSTGDWALLAPLERTDREESLAEWLTVHGANEGCAGPLAATGVSLAALDQLATSIQGEALDAALRWIAAGCVVRTLASEIETSASRIHEIVGAVKGFTFMDHAPTPEPVDIRRGVTDTLTMLAAKVRAKSVSVQLQLPPSLPPAHAVGAELNQVWMNLIDNAIDAVEPGGRVEVTADAAIGRVLVRVTDSGPGIPVEIQGRIFEPFFTTKGIGKGTGLGLDIVRRLVERHEGSVEVESQPGRTVFTVALPAAAV